MKTTRDVGALLKAADPVSNEPALSESDRARIRHAMLNVPRECEQVRPIWFRTFAAGAVAALLIVAATIAGFRFPNQPGQVTQKAIVLPAEPVERRQVQFATPGGTRIIWTLNPEFKVGGTAP